jgi:hypothetical protein
MATKTLRSKTRRTKTLAYAASAKPKRAATRAALPPDRKGAAMRPMPDGSPRLDPSGRFDLSTTEGTRAWEEDYDRRRAIADDFYGARFKELNGHLDQLDERIVRMLAFASAESVELMFDVGKLAELSVALRVLFPDARPDESREEKSSALAAGGRAATAGDHGAPQPNAPERGKRGENGPKGSSSRTRRNGEVRP